MPQLLLVVLTLFVMEPTFGAQNKCIQYAEQIGLLEKTVGDDLSVTKAFQAAGFFKRRRLFKSIKQMKTENKISKEEIEKFVSELSLQLKGAPYRFRDELKSPLKDQLAKIEENEATQLKVRERLEKEFSALGWMRDANKREKLNEFLLDRRFQFALTLILNSVSLFQLGTLAYLPEIRAKTFSPESFRHLKIYAKMKTIFYAYVLIVNLLNAGVHSYEKTIEKQDEVSRVATEAFMKVSHELKNSNDALKKKSVREELFEDWIKEYRSQNIGRDPDPHSQKYKEMHHLFLEN
ncbi:MAG: hypothetical protein JWQ35_284 [Bacteriovoracaceae bacterium]|nr:hypothetical protein [Bacteriovoracaceae bacterium]